MAPTVVVMHGKCASQSGVAGHPQTYVSVACSQDVKSFFATANTTAVVLELEWDPGIQKRDMWLYLQSPADEWTQVRPQSPAQPPLRFQLDDPEEGEWGVRAFVDGASAMFEYKVHVTLFPGPVPEGYTAMPQGSGA